MAETRVNILISAIDEASETFQGVLSNSESMAAKLSRTADTLGDLGNLASEFTEPLSKGLENSKNAAISFESGMAEVRKTTGLGAVQTAALGDEIKKLSRTIPLTAAALTEIGVAAGQSGVAMSEIPQYIKDVSKASVALAVDTDEAGLAFGRLTNIYGMSNSEIPKLAAAINVLGDSSVASEKEILKTIMRTAGLSKQANLTAKDSAALAASFVSLGMAPQVAATAINALLSRMTTAEIQSARFQKGLAMVGMSGKELQNLTAESGTKAIFTLGAALDRLDPQERAKAIGLMFGAEHSDNVGVFIDRMDVFKNSLGSVADDQQNVTRYNEVFATQLSTTESQMQLLNNAFQEMAIEIGTALLPAIKAFAAFLTPIINKTTEFAKKHPNIVRLGSALAGLAISLGPLLFGLSALVKGWSIFTAGIPIISTLSNRFLGLNNPISRFVGWLARGNQRLLGMQDAAGGIIPPEMGGMPKTKETLPICIEPVICDGFSDKLKALAAGLDVCLPVCICPELCDATGTNKVNPKADTDQDKIPKGEALPAEDKAEKPAEAPALPAPATETPKTEERENLTLPQIAMLAAALGATVVAVQKLTDSNAGLGEKIVSVATAIGAGLAAKSVMSAKTPQEEAAEVGAIQQQNAQALAATQQANADQLGASQLANAQALAAVTAANQAAEIASQDKIAAGKLAAQQASNQLAMQQLQAQLAAQREAAAVQVAATAQQASIMVAARSQMAATDIAASQQIAATQVAAAQQVGAQQLATAQQVGAQQVAAAQQAGAQQVAAAQQVAEVQASAAQTAAIAAETKAQAEAETVANTPPPRQEESGGGGGMIKNVAMLAAGALGLGGVALAVSKVAGGLGGAVGGLLNATKSVAGAVGTVGGAVGKVGGAVGGVIEKGNQVARGVGGVAGGAIGTGIRGLQAGNTAAQGIGQVAGTGIGGVIKSLGAVNNIAKDSGASIGNALGNAIKGTQSLGEAANTAGSGIAGAFSKAGNTIAGSVARVGNVTNSAAANMGSAWGKVQKAAGVTGTAMRGATGALSSVLAPAKTGTVGIGSTFSKSISGIAGGAKTALSGAIGQVSKLAASPAGKLIVPAATSLAGTVGAASLAGNQQPETPPIPEATALPQTNNIVPFSRRSATTPAPAEITAAALPPESPPPSEQLATASAKNNIVPLVRSSQASGRAIGAGLAAGIESSRPQAELAAAGLAQSVSSYLPRSPAERGPLSDLDETGFGLTQEFIKGINSNAIQSKFQEALNPDSKLSSLSLDAKSGGGNTATNTYSPTYHINAGGSEDFISQLEKHDRQFMDWLDKTREQFSRGRY